MQHNFENLGSFVRLALGLILFMVGVMGLVIPVLHSAILIVIALPLMSPRHGKQMADWLKRRFKRFRN